MLSADHKLLAKLNWGVKIYGNLWQIQKLAIAITEKCT